MKLEYPLLHLREAPVPKLNVRSKREARLHQALLARVTERRTTRQRQRMGESARAGRPASGLNFPFRLERFTSAARN